MRNLLMNTITIRPTTTVLATNVTNPAGSGSGATPVVILAIVGLAVLMLIGLGMIAVTVRRRRLRAKTARTNAKSVDEYYNLKAAKNTSAGMDIITEPSLTYGGKKWVVPLAMDSQMGKE